jgi:hypothetical protein
MSFRARGRCIRQPVANSVAGWGEERLCGGIGQELTNRCVLTWHVRHDSLPQVIFERSIGPASISILGRTVRLRCVSLLPTAQNNLSEQPAASGVQETDMRSTAGLRRFLH